MDRPAPPLSDLAITYEPSPNFGPRRGGARPDMVVLHYTAMQSAEAALTRLCDPVCEVSAHYLICPKGRVWRMVAEEMRAWHAGAGAWGDVTDVNSRSIGIELSNAGDHPFAEPQMAALEALLRAIMTRWEIAPHRIIGHSDMAPARKIDPGVRFDWRRLARRGLSVWPAPQGAPQPKPLPKSAWEAFLRDAARFGYRRPDVVGGADAAQSGSDTGSDGGNDTGNGAAPSAEALLLDAFRQRFRPWAAGQGAPLDGADCAAMADLAARYGL
ncbi:N-acetylmuramoyl-L-alanine amidase [Litorivita sp. NS0012-18]|uniref:N-acetylmuramoyl-L-alanine amidase n=1 Tax=Litorivita sp. NS0012-18 TaxID=3127655 RepID=UPI003108952C